ncbi:MAG: hypothetical protein K2R98_25705 [Gemmataceae bacterium]|nr:hypothetical protein [Gemmataceae bacterium]
MDRQNLINRLVANKLQAAGSTKFGCVPCFGSANRAFGMSADRRQALCIPAAQPRK